MSCMLRIGGDTLDIDALLSLHPFEINRLWRKGEPRGSAGKVHTNSGASAVVSDAEFEEFDLQVGDATAFLETHGPIVAQAACFPGVDYAVLDFAVALRMGYLSQSSCLPPRLIQLAALAGIGLEISHYPCSADEEADT